MRGSLADVSLAEMRGQGGALLRLCACMGAKVDLIEPIGFERDDRRVRRTAIDDIDHVPDVSALEAFKAASGPRRLFLFTTKADQSAYEFAY